AALRLFADLAGDGAALREHAGGVAVGTGVFEGEGRVEVGDADDAEHGPEELVASCGAGRIDVIEDGGGEPVAVFAAGGGLRTAAVEAQARPLIGGARDRGLQPFQSG